MSSDSVTERLHALAHQLLACDRQEHGIPGAVWVWRLRAEARELTAAADPSTLPDVCREQGCNPALLPGGAQ